MPGEGEEFLWLHFLDDGVPFEVFVAWPGDVSRGGFAGDEGSVEVDAEPLAEFFVVGEGAPDTGDGGVEVDFFADFVGGGGHFDWQPRSCRLRLVAIICNRFVAYLFLCFVG